MNYRYIAVILRIVQIFWNKIAECIISNPPIWLFGAVSCLVCKLLCAVVVLWSPLMILNPAARVRFLSGGKYTIRLRSLHRAYPSLHSVGVVHWVPEQLNIKAVTGAWKLIDGCSLELCSATPSVASSGICHRNKVYLIVWLYRDGLAIR